MYLCLQFAYNNQQVAMADAGNPGRSRRLLLPGLAPYTKKKDIMEAFQHCEVRGVVVLQRPEGNMAYLTFDSPEARDEALEIYDKVVIHKRTLKPMRADVWHDLKIHRSKPDPEPATDPQPRRAPKETPILPVDCIAKIASFLPYKERARMEQVSRLWREGARASHSGTTDMRATSWVWNDGWETGFSLEGFHWAMLRYGRYLRRLDLSDTVDLKTQAVTVASKMCSQLTYLDISTVIIREAALREIGMRLTKLEHLKMGRCIGPVDPDLQFVLDRNWNLKELDIVMNDFTGKSLVFSKNLQELRVARCNNITCEALSACIGLQSNLRRLEIRDCANVRTVGVIGAVIENASLTNTLEKLAIHGPGPDEIIMEEEGFEEEQEGFLELREVINEAEDDFIELPEVVNGPSPRLAKAISSVIHLQLSVCGWVNRGVLEDISERLRGLKALDISFNTDLQGPSTLNCLAKLNQCEELRMNCLHPSIRGDCLGSMTSLKYLECRDNQGITNGDVRSLLDACQELYHANFEGCANIGRPVVNAAYSTTEKRRTSLQLYLGDTYAVAHRRDRRNWYLTIHYIRYSQKFS